MLRSPACRSHGSFIGELCGFMSEFHTEIIASNGQEDEASALTCKLVHGIFIQLHLVRAVAAQARDVGAELTKN
jgi:hypothetical protein